MKITIEFRTDNAAFENPRAELYNVLTSVCHKIVDEGLEEDFERKVMDSYGNTVGTVRGELEE